MNAHSLKKATVFEPFFGGSGCREVHKQELEIETMNVWTVIERLNRLLTVIDQLMGA